MEQCRTMQCHNLVITYLNNYKKNLDGDYLKSYLYVHSSFINKILFINRTLLPLPMTLPLTMGWYRWYCHWQWTKIQAISLWFATLKPSISFSDIYRLLHNIFCIIPIISPRVFRFKGWYWPLADYGSDMKIDLFECRCNNFNYVFSDALI